VENQRNLVNVAVSRAQRALIVFGDATALADYPVPTLHALITNATTSTRSSHPQSYDALAEVADLHSEAERRLYAAFLNAGIAPRLKPLVEGYELDFAIDTPHGPLNVEVDGIHHLDARGRQRRQDLARDAILQRLGWRVVRIPAWRCLTDPKLAAREILAAPAGEKSC
jgi:very-short-patch-repair endonuclease